MVLAVRASDDAENPECTSSLVFVTKTRVLFPSEGSEGLYEALARLYRDKFHDHARAAENFEKASRLPGHASYDERFSAYELSYCEGREREAYARLRALYQRGEKERLPRLLNQLRAMEERLKVPANERIP